MPQPQSGPPNAFRAPQGLLFLWPDHWQVWGRLLPNQSHRHISASLLIGLDGPFRLQCHDQWRSTRAALVAPDTPQALDPADTRMWVVQLDPDCAHWLCLRHLLAGQASVDLEVADDLLRAGPEPDCEAMRLRLEQLVARYGSDPSDLDERIAACCRILREELPERLVLARLAAAVGLSSSRLTHLFRSQTGVSLRRFLLHLKMSRALASWEPGKAVSQLAAEAGFYDQPHLVRTAREMFDALPSVYVTAGWFQVCRCDLR